MQSVVLVDGALPSEASSTQSYLQFYTMGNYHWSADNSDISDRLRIGHGQPTCIFPRYLKHERLLTGPQPVFAWHPEAAFRYYLAYGHGRVETVQLAVRVLRPHCASKDDQGHVGADGKGRGLGLLVCFT